jgi:hypothetical protein
LFYFMDKFWPMIQIVLLEIVKPELGCCAMILNSFSFYPAVYVSHKLHSRQDKSWPIRKGYQLTP